MNTIFYLFLIWIENNKTTSILLMGMSHIRDRGNPILYIGEDK